MPPAPRPAPTSGVAVQHRTVRTLVGSQMLGGVGVASGVAVGSLLAEDVSGSAELAGLGGTFQVLGGALIAVPMARLMARSGRRPGLVMGYVLGILGAVLLIVAGVVRSFPLLLVASVLFGGATTANSQARYAAADLADDAHRGRDLSIVVWATTVGAVLGPNLVGLAGGVADVLHLPALTGAFVFSLVGFALAAVLLTVRLRPDPLLLARRRAHDAAPHDLVERPHGSVVRGARVVLASPAALLGLVAVALGHVVMVSVMVMTPLHMHHGGSTLRLIGLVISIHILGMYALSPVVGTAVDRFGARPVVGVGSVVLLAACLLAAQAPTGWSPGLAVGLFLLGVGWSCTLVSGSTLIAGAVPVAERAGAQGASDLAMGLAAGGGGALAGVVVGQLGYGALGLGAAVVAVAIGLAAAFLRGPRGHLVETAAHTPPGVEPTDSRVR
ncbi:MFS transporter [Phycicoccus sp. Root101]|uniref:MFS transporter n=1 Tax=Phycicoccus sp. Root101 TaxID=1736421 RepID=UPI001F321CD0|nr:MFS transporter [Phycicoccus sp. Root101]